MRPGGGATDSGTREQQVETLAAAWRSAVIDNAYIPLSPATVRVRFESLANDVLNALAEPDGSEVLTQRGRAIGRTLIDLNLIRQESLEQTLACLSEQLASVEPPARLSRLLIGIAGGFVAGAESTLLRQQESMSRAATTALLRTQRELKQSRDQLEAINVELSAQIVERTRAEEIQRDYAERLQRLHSIDLAILSAESLPAIYDVSVDHLQNLIPSLNISLIQIDVAEATIVVLKSTNESYPTGRTTRITMTQLLDQLAAGKDVYLPDLRALQAQSPEAGMIATLGGRSMLAVPLRYGEELIGGLTITLREVRHFTPAEIAVAHEVAGSLAVAIQNRRLLEAEQEAHRREMTLREVAASLNLGLDRDELLNLILAQLNRVMPCQSSAIMLLDDRGQLAVAAQHGNLIEEYELNRMLSERPGSIWRVLQTGKTYIINDTYHSPDWFQSLGHAYIRAWLGVPLLVKGVCLGVLTIDRDEPNAFNEKDEELALTFASQAAIAIDNVRMFARQQAYAGELEQAVSERTRELEVLYGITAAAVGDPELDSLLARALELTVGVFDCVAAAVHLIEGEEGGLQPAYVYERRPEVGEGLRGLAGDEPCLLRPLQIGAPIITDGDDLPADWPGRAGLTLGVVPLRRRERNLGVLSLVCETDDHLAGEGLPLLTTIADQLAVAVENIRLRQVMRQSAIIEERERLARDIHDAITQAIYGISLFAETASGYATAGKLDKVQQSIQSIQQASDQALRELRLLLYELRTERLARKGLVGALRERLQTVEHRAEILGGVHAPATALNGLPVPLEETFYRVAMEALNNALRHSGAKRVDVTLMVEDGHLVMSIVDDGIGFDPATAIDAGGLGLESMHKRIGKVNGQLEMLSGPGQGTRIIARAPLPAADGSQGRETWTG